MESIINTDGLPEKANNDTAAIQTEVSNIEQQSNADIQNGEFSHSSYSLSNMCKPDIVDENVNVTSFGEHLNYLLANKEELITKGKENIAVPIKISASEFVYDIWLYEFDNDDYSLKGIYRDGILIKLQSMGYYKRVRENNSYFFIHEHDNIINDAAKYNMKDSIWNYIKAINTPLEFEFSGLKVFEKPEKLRETFLRQSHLIFNDAFLEQLSVHEKPILRDTKEAAFFYFKNHIIKVTQNGREVVEYANLLGYCIWGSQIIQRAFEFVEDFRTGHFVKFIRNVCNNEQNRYSTIKSAIGYLLHHSKSPTKAQAVIAYDECITDIFNPMGGTGKGLLGNALMQLRNVVTIDGKKFKPDDKFKFQRITDSTQIVWVDDPPPGFPFEIFNSVLTEGWDIEKKYQTEYHINPEDSPKLYISSNGIMSGSGTTVKRRQFITEFSDHYSKLIENGNEEPIKTEHGCIFFDKNDWDTMEFNKFYSFMLDCVTYHLNNGLVYCEPKGMSKNYLIQSTSEEFVAWVNGKSFQLGEKYITPDLYEDFKTSFNYGGDFKQRKLTDWLKKYASNNGWKLELKHSGNTSFFSFVKIGGNVPVL